MDFMLDTLVAKAEHDERVRQAERAAAVWELLAAAPGRPSPIAALTRRWRRWRGRLAEAAPARATPGAAR
jgi:hypothetical protein